MTTIGRTYTFSKPLFFLCLLMTVLVIVPQNSAAESWVLLRSGQDENYYYDKDSVVEIEKGIKEVYDASRTTKSTSKRKVRVDCVRHTYALGETIGWVGEREVSHLYLNKNGWVWLDAKGLNPKLVKVVCSAK